MAHQSFADRMEDLRQRHKRLADAHHKITRQAVLEEGGAGWSEFREAFAQWRYEHPFLGGLVTKSVKSCLVVIVVYSLWLAAGTAVGTVVGLDSVRSRITHAYYAAVWASKIGGAASIEPMEPQQRQGYIEQVINDMLVVSFFQDGKQLRRLIKPANVVVQNSQGFKSWATAFQLQPVKLDFYTVIGNTQGYDVWATVIWQNREPINVQLVELRLGEPEVSPPTAVVNRVYSEYYWQLARFGETVNKNVVQ